MKWRDFPRRPTAATGNQFPAPVEVPDPWVPIDDHHRDDDGWDDADDKVDDGEAIF